MHDFSPTSPVLGVPLPLLPAQPSLCWLYLSKGLVARCFFCLASFSCLERSNIKACRNVAVWLSQGVVKPSPYSLKNVYLYFNLVGSLPEVFVANFFHPLYSQDFLQPLINQGGLNPFQCDRVHSPCLCSI